MKAPQWAFYLRDCTINYQGRQVIKMSDEKKELQKKYVELQMIDAQINQIQKQIQMLDSQLMELEMINVSLDDFGNISAGTEILTSLAPGIYTKAELKDNDEL